MVNMFVSDEEQELIRSSLILPLVISAVEEEMQALEGAKITIKRLFLMSAYVLIQNIKQEIARVRKELWRQQIKVVAQDFEHNHSYAIVVRGFNQLVEMSKEEVRREIAARLESFSNQALQRVGWEKK